MSVVSELSGGREAFLESGIEACRVLASAFVDLPTKEGVEGLLALDPATLEGSASGDALASFVRAWRGRNPEDALIEIGRDRAALVRGHAMEGFVPPYESLYVGREPNASIAGLNRFYAEHGFARTDEVKDASDQIGLEFAFAAVLLERELAALAVGEEGLAARTADALAAFMEEHLGRWAHLYANALHQAAKTDYWKAVALMILECEQALSA